MNKCKLISPGVPHKASFVVNDVDVLEAGCVQEISVLINAELSEACISFKCGFPEIDVDGSTEPPAEFLKLAKVFGFVKG